MATRPIILYVLECVEGTIRLMRSNFEGPVNVGSEEMVTINQLADMIMAIAGKRLEKRHITGPLGVRGRNSDNRLIEEKLGWKPAQPLSDGLAVTYEWIERQVMSNSRIIRRRSSGPSCLAPGCSGAVAQRNTRFATKSYRRVMFLDMTRLGG